MKFLINILKKIKNKIRIYFFLAPYRKDLPQNTKKFYERMVYLKRSEFIKRVKYCNDTKVNNKIVEQLERDGYIILDLNSILENENFKYSFSLLKKKYLAINWNTNDFHKKEYLKQLDLKFTETIKNFSDPFADIATKYLGSLSLLDSCQFWYSPNKNNDLIGSQLYHRDPEDFRQLKIFIPIEEISERNGPLNVLNANDSTKLLENLLKNKKIIKRNQKISDLEAEKYGTSKKQKILLKQNQCAIVDTCRCYHFGSRKSELDRKLIFLHFTTAFSGKTPVIRRYDTENEFTSERDKLIYGLQNKTINHYKNKKYLIY